MESKQIRSSVIARLVGFDELRRPLQPVLKRQSFLADAYPSNVAPLGVWNDKYSSKKGQEETRDVLISETCKREKQTKGFVRERNTKFSSGFLVATQAKEIFRAHLQRPPSLVSRHIIDAQATPPHRRKRGMKSADSGVFGKMENRRKFGRRIDFQNLKSKPKLKHYDSVDPLKPEFGKKENSLRCFSLVNAPSDSHLGDRNAGQDLLLENKWLSAKAKERRKLFNGTQPLREKDTFSGEIGPNSMFSTSRDSMLSVERIGCETLAEETQLKLIFAPSFISKDENYDSLYCSSAYPECPMSQEEVYQPSPVSVLEPMFDGDALEDLQRLPHLNLRSLEQQLEILKSESVDSYSEGSGMVVSSDEESDEESVFNPKVKENKNKEESIESFGAQESREISYVDNVLAEAGFHNSKRVSLDLPIDHMIFEKLEKKYSKEPSWKRSERRLLFDRVNSGLVELLESSIGALTWKKPVSRRLGSVLSMPGLKDELRKLLATQEKQAKKESSAKAPAINDGGWFELEEDIESVVRELETMLVDELLAEIFSVG